MDWKLEVVPVPVSDVDRAKRFYGEQVGFVVDLDTRIGDEIRVVQLTPPGSGCSIHLSTGILTMPPGVLEGLQLVVSDIDAARAELVERGVEVSPVQHMEDGVWIDGKGGYWNSFARFSDPGGNGWVLREAPAGRWRRGASRRVRHELPAAPAHHNASRRSEPRKGGRAWEPSDWASRCRWTDTSPGPIRGWSKDSATVASGSSPG